jgi:hypothetical protein
MSKTGTIDRTSAELSAEAIREQLDLLIQHSAIRSSKRSVEFLRYVVEQTLDGCADQIKERTIGVGVFGREPSYDTNMDHVVRTAAIELRKRLAIYYGDEEHRSELRVSLVPGSYIPHFTLPAHAPLVEIEAGADSVNLPAEAQPLVPDPRLDVEAGLAKPVPLRRSQAVNPYVIAIGVAILAIAGYAGYSRFHPRTAQELFWRPVLQTPGTVLLAVGDVPNGPPTPGSSSQSEEKDSPLPTLHAASTPTVPFGDTVTIARVVGILEQGGKHVAIRRENSSSFSDLREGPVVLIGAFNNGWSLRLTHQLRYTLSLDDEKHLIYIKDARNPLSRSWSWATNHPIERPSGPGGPVLHDYALISRIWNSDTGHVVIAIGGLYSYGTQAAGEFLDDPQLMQTVASAIPLEAAHKNMQIVLGTTVTDGTPGPPKVLGVSIE